MSHTPGPWFVEGCGGIQMDGIRDGYLIGSESERKVASLYPHGAKERKQRWEDANLIATAPDMLQLLKDINNAAWSINSSLGNRIRELIHRAEGTNA